MWEGRQRGRSALQIEIRAIRASLSQNGWPSSGLVPDAPSDRNSSDRVGRGGRLGAAYGRNVGSRHDAQGLTQSGFGADGHFESAMGAHGNLQSVTAARRAQCELDPDPAADHIVMQAVCPPHPTNNRRPGSRGESPPVT